MLTKNKKRQTGRRKDQTTLSNNKTERRKHVAFIGRLREGKGRMISRLRYPDQPERKQNINNE